MSSKTEEELIKMNFKQLKEHCKSLNLKTEFGSTKGAMIKVILANDPTPTQTSGDKEEDELKRQLVDNYGFDEKISIINYDENGYKNNEISVSEARKIVKQYCPITARYPAFVSFFKAEQFQNLSIQQFINALLAGNDKLLGIHNVERLASVLKDWNDDKKNGGWDLAKQQLNGFQPTPKCNQQEKLMFSLFTVPHLISKVSIILLELIQLRDRVWHILYFMERLNEILREVIDNDTYCKIFLSSIILSKYREQDIRLSEFEKYKDVIDFLQKTTKEPSAREIFISERWQTLMNEPDFIMNAQTLNNVKPQFIMNDEDLNKIKAKAIKFGSAIDPQMPRIKNAKIEQQAKRDQIKKDIGTVINTKELQNKLENALHFRLNNSEEQQNDVEEKQMDDNKCEDLKQYRKMLTIGVKIDAVLHEMRKNDVSEDIINEFRMENENKKSNDIDSVSVKPEVRRILPNALQQSINANINRTAPTIPGPYHSQYRPYHRGIALGEHDNDGINWKRAINEHQKIVYKLQTLRKLIYTFDKEWYAKKKTICTKCDDGINDEKNGDLYDNSLNIYLIQINRMDAALKDWMIKSDENAAIIKKLEITYHSKFRPTIFKELTTSKYDECRKAINEFDSDIFVSDDIMGIIWMFIKPFDQLIELKFAVQCANQFWDKEKKKIALKKLPNHGHRG